MSSTEESGRTDHLPQWSISIHLLGDRFFIGDTLKLAAVTGLGAYGILGLMVLVAGRANRFPWGATAAVIAAAAVLLGIAMLLGTPLLFGNRFEVEYQIEQQGIAWRSKSRVAHSASRVAIVLGALFASAQLAGAGLLAATRETGSLRWSNVRSVDEYSERRILCLRNGWRTLLRIYCTEENYPAVLSLVNAKVAGRR